jgi:hypothetical protein
MLYDFLKYRLLKQLEYEAEKTARYIELLEIANTCEVDMLIDRAVIRYYALLRRIESIKIKQKAAQH